MQFKKQAVAVAVAVAMGMMSGQAIADVAFYGQGDKTSFASTVPSPEVTTGFDGAWDGATSPVPVFALYGGYCESDDASIHVANNTVAVNGGTINVICGGWSENSQVNNNTVTISNGTVNSVFGGYSASDKDVTGNTVTISGGTVDYVYGGFSGIGSAGVAAGTGNHVYIKGGTFRGEIYGGRVDCGEFGGSANTNTVSISGSATIEASSTEDPVRIVGGYVQDSSGSSVSNNVVTITGGTFKQLSNSINIYGGYSNDGNAKANSNTVILCAGNFSNVTAGSVGSGNGETNHNVVIWEGGKISAGLNGGSLNGGSSNTLAIIGSGKTVSIVDKFQNYLFVISNKSVIQEVSTIDEVSVAEGKALLKVETAPTLVKTESKTDQVAVAFADGFDTSQVKVGSKTVLMNVGAGSTYTTTDADTIVLDLEDGGNTYAASAISKAISKVNEYSFGVSKEQKGSDYYLIAELEDIAPNDLTLSTRDIAYANLVNFRSQMSDVNQRMGELRTMRKDGGWARIYGGTYSFGEGRKDKSFTLQVGADRWFDANSYVGVMGSYTKAEDTLTNGENDQKNWNVGFYTGYVADSGLFWNATVRHGKIENKYNLSSLTPVSGKYSTYGTSASVEGGWRFDCPSTNFYVEPQGELMYGHMQSVTYNAGDVTIKNDAVNTLVGRVGVAAGYKFAEDQGNLYLRTSLLHDFKGKVKTQAVSGNETDGGFTKDFGGTWGEFVLGGNYKATKNVNLYGEMTCTTQAAGVRTKWQGNVGVRYTF